MFIGPSMASQTLPSPRLSRQPQDLEERRAKSLAQLAILDTAVEPEFEGIVALAAHICDAPTAMISLLDRERLWCKATRGMEGSSFPREDSFCTHSTGLAVGELLVVEDTHLDSRFVRNPYVLGAPHIRFYAGAPIRDALGVVLGVVCVNGYEPRVLDRKQRDLLQILAHQVEALLQERLRTRAAIRERRIHELVSDSLTDAVILVDRQERIFRWNYAAQVLYGFRTDEALGQHISIIGAGDLYAGAHASNVRAALARHRSYHGPHELRHKDGSMIAIDLDARLVDDGEGRFFYLTVHRKADERPAPRGGRDSEHLIHANRMATHGSLAAGVGHELSNVGQVLQLSVEKLSRDVASNRPLDASDLETFEFVATHLRTHAHNLLSAARLPGETTEAFDPSDVVRSVVAKLRETGRTKHLDVITELPAQREILFQNRASLEQVLTNLVTNAADAIRGIGAKSCGTRITVRLAVDDDGNAELVVEDDGPGMTEELQASIFDPYFTTKPTSRGNGLGLPVVARIVTRTFGGKLHLASKPGAGTTVTFTMPAPKADSKAA